jgi:hypothetical protein
MQRKAVSSGDVSRSIPIVHERLKVGRKRVESGRVIVKTTTSSDAVQVNEPLEADEARIERVPVNRFVEAPVPPAFDGDVFVIPVIEEVGASWGPTRSTVAGSGPGSSPRRDATGSAATPGHGTGSRNRFGTRTTACGSARREPEARRASARRADLTATGRRYTPRRYTSPREDAVERHRHARDVQGDLAAR